MSGATWLQLGALIVAIGATAPVLGRYMAKVYGPGDGERPLGDRFFLRVERPIYRLCGVDPHSEQRWTTYAYSLLGFSLMSFLSVYLLLRFQAWLPLDPTGMPAPDEHLSFNTAVSFMTNTNWQSYGGEATLSHFSQMVGLAVQNFVSAAAGMAVMAALIRGIARRRASTLGNFWVDLTRTTIRVLLPFAAVIALILVSQGVIQNVDGFDEVTTVEGTSQVIPGGPVASQVAIKQLGTNGGGFFSTNSAHPFENSTPFGNLVETYAIAIIPFALAFTYGHMVRDKRQGRAVFAVMAAIWLAMTLVAMGMETNGNPELARLGVDQSMTADNAGGGNLEGKEVRFGSGASGMWAGTTTGTSNGSVNSMHDSYTPMGGGSAMIHMMLGEVSPGGVGVGLNGLLVMAILSVFIAGLMVGRTPEYLGKKIQATEMKLVVLYVLAMPVTVLGFAAASVLLDSAQTTNNPGAHGLSEILYAFTSAANNNGSAFAGLTTATQWYDTTLGLAMLIGRFFLIIPVLAIAGSLARKQPAPVTAGTFPTHTPLFGGLVIGVVAIVAGLTFFPALALGPIVEQLSI
jgi:K+-transporting ATPase ATPase A chain